MSLSHRICRRKTAKKSLGRLIQNKSGASAIEFAIVAPVFLMLVFSTFEVGWFFFVNASVDSAMTNAARYIRTGQAQKGGYTGQAKREDFLKDHVCKAITFLSADQCKTKMTVEVQTFSSFAQLAADATTFTCRDSDPKTIENLMFNPGSDNSIVRVRLCLIYKTLNPAVGLSLAANAQGELRVTASYILRVEPYSQGGA